MATAQLSVATFPVRYATNPPDIHSFIDKHKDDGAVILFVDLSSSESGIFDGVFNLFLDSSSNFEIDVENSLVDKFPTMKVDLSKASLKSTEKEYEVEELSFIVFYYKGEELYRGEPDMDTVEELEKLVKEKNSSEAAKGNSSKNVESSKNDTKVEAKPEQNESATHNHSDALVLTPDYGHLSSVESPSASQNLKSNNVEQKSTPTTEESPATQEPKPVNSLPLGENQQGSVVLNRQAITNQVPTVNYPVAQSYPTAQNSPTAQSYPAAQSYSPPQGHLIPQGLPTQSHSAMPSNLANPNQQAIQTKFQPISQQNLSGYRPARAGQPQISAAAKAMIEQRVPKHTIKSYIASGLPRRF